MASVDRDLDEILSFCKNFQSQYLETLRANAARLKTISTSVEASLGNTKFATNASTKLTETAESLMKTAETGEERIREIERRTRQQKEEKHRLEEQCR